ncbi:MAG: hypothetical protein ACLP53_19570 [Isosphaeraceae bacterium]
MATRTNSQPREGACIYCGEVDDLTSDHVPPRSFFPTPPPPNLITVPSCRGCNESFGKIDDYVRLMLTVDEKAAGNQDRNEVLPAALRFSQRRQARRILSDFYESLTFDYRLNPKGIYVKAQLYTVKGERMDKFARRVIKALFYHEKGYRLPDDHQVNPIHHSRWSLLQGEALEFLVWIVDKLSITPPKTWGTTFGYRWLESPNGPSMTWWLLELYGTTRYVCSTTPVN